MDETVARWLATAAVAYTMAGLLFAVAFAIRGAGVLVPLAMHGSWGFRLLIVPGAATMWPYLLVRWWQARR